MFACKDTTAMQPTMLRCVLFLPLLTAIVDGTDIQEWTFKMNRQKSNFSLSVLQEKPGISRIQCMVECSQSKGCFTLEYKRSGSVCTKYRLFSNEDGKAALTRSSPDVHSFTMSDPRGQHHGENCSCHVDCVDDRTQCVDNVCICLTGYSLNSEDGSCIKDLKRLHLGETCSSDNECVDDWTQCTDNMCLCMAGYSLKHGDSACTKDPKGQHYGEECFRASECVNDRTQCLDGECKCQPGYSFNPKDRSCIEGQYKKRDECEEYGESFSLVSYRYCSKGFNDDQYSFLNRRRCGNKCTQSRGFTCLSFELWNGGCYLSKSTRLDVPDEDWKVYDGCEHYQRNCA